MLDGTPQDDAVQTDVHDHDIVIVGAGLSGICAGWHLTRSRPSADIAILEAPNNARTGLAGPANHKRQAGVFG